MATPWSSKQERESNKLKQGFNTPMFQSWTPSFSCSNLLPDWLACCLSVRAVPSAAWRHTTARKRAGVVDKRCSDMEGQESDSQRCRFSETERAECGGWRETPVVGKRMPLTFGSAARLDVRRTANRRLCWTPGLRGFQSCQSMKAMPT